MLTQTIPNEVVASPARILQTGLGFWSSRVLQTAVHLKLFTLISESGMTAEDIRETLGLQERGLNDFLDALVALKFLYREGSDSHARYYNSMEADVFLNRNRTTYMGGILEMAHNRLYDSWSHMEKALRTGLPQNEIGKDESSAYEILYTDKKKLAEFVHAMAGAQMGSFISFARQFNCAGYRTHCDIGGSGGDLSIQLALHHPEMRSVTFDLPEVTEVARENIAGHQLAERVSAVAGNFFRDELPKADMITMAHVLHNWDLEKRKILLQKAYEALPAGGVLVALENVIDDSRKENIFGLLMSLNMLINTKGGANFSFADFTGWIRETGFSRASILHLEGSSSALIAYK
jgi:hypothetical protein